MVRAVELQDSLSKTQLVERITELQKAHPENEQRNAVLTGNRKSEEDRHRAVPTPHGDEVILHRDAQEKQERGKSKRRQNKPDADDNPNGADSSHESSAADETPPPPNLDIKV